MNYNAMTLPEMIHYLDLYNNDPVVQRLIHRLDHSDLMVELEEAGMDPVTGMFKDDYDRYSPGEYIEHLRRDRDEAESELASTKYEFEDLEEKYNQLKTRSIMQFIEEVKMEQQANQALVKDAMATIQSFKKENERLKEQIDMWGRMNKV
jgi:FMN phosphatase YigB (HAD superfamily)